MDQLRCRRLLCNGSKYTVFCRLSTYVWKYKAVLSLSHYTGSHPRNTFSHPNACLVLKLDVCWVGKVSKGVGRGLPKHLIRRDVVQQQPVTCPGFKKWKKSKYLGTILANRNYMHEEINSRLNFGNASVRHLSPSCLLRKSLNQARGGGHNFSFFPKLQEPHQNSRRQENYKKPVPYWGPTNIRRQQIPI